jgi:hypothetical protein
VTSKMETTCGSPKLVKPLQQSSNPLRLEALMGVLLKKKNLHLRPNQAKLARSRSLPRAPNQARRLQIGLNLDMHCPAVFAAQLWQQDEVLCTSASDVDC